MKKLFKAIAIILLIIILIPTGFVYLRPNRIISKEQAKAELSLPASRFLKWRGAEIHYTDEGTGKPVLMIHGFGGSYHNFDKLATLMKNDYRVIRIDLPGFGLSDFPPVNNHEDYTADYKNYFNFLLDTLHLDSLYVIGNSMGGGMTWMLAGDHPNKVRKIVLLASAGYETEKVAAKLAMFKYKSVSNIFDKGMPLFMSESGAKNGYADDSKIDPAVTVVNNKFSNREGNIAHMLNLARTAKFPDTALIQLVQCPTLIIWGKQDMIVPVEHSLRFNRDIKNSRIIYYDPCGHMPMMELPERTYADVVKFFSEAE